MKLKTLLAAACLAVFCSCATMQVTTDYDHSKDFTGLKTYDLYENNNRSVSDLNSDRIVNAVRAQLKAKGYTETNDSPDFKVNINTVVKNMQQVTANTDFYGYGGVYRPYGYWVGGPDMATTTFDVDNYKEGSVIIDMIDTASGKMFWEGVGNKEIDSPASNPDQAINDAMAKILASFPAAGTQPGTKK